MGLFKSNKREPVSKLNIRKNDIVRVIGGEDRGMEGKILKVFPKKQQIIVEGINFIKRHTKPSQDNPQGGIIEKEGPIHFSNVMVVCPNCGKPTRIGIKVLGDGSRARICRNCGEMIVAS